jgi:hypothetical protein
MNKVARLVLIYFCVIVVGCAAQQPLRKRTIEAPTLSCEEANRLAYRTIITLGYSAASLQVARPGQPGSILAKKEGAPDGKVTITCNSTGAVVEPEKTGLAVPSLLGAAERPNEFPQVFTQTFNILRTQKEYELSQGPGKGLSMTLTRLNSFESQMDLGADLPASGVLPIRVEINNNTARPYGLDASKVYLMSAGGERVSPMASPAAGQGKALLGEITLQPGQTMTGYLFYPAGHYSSARTTLIDKETDEGEGFSVQF